MLEISIMEVLAQFKNILANLYIYILLALIALDITTGYFKAFRFKKVNSSVGQEGLTKHATTIILVLMLYPFLSLLGFVAVANFFCSFFALNYLISVLENAGQLNVPIPRFVLSTLIKAKSSMEEATDFNKNFINKK